MAIPNNDCSEPTLTIPQPRTLTLVCIGAPSESFKDMLASNCNLLLSLPDMYNQNLSMYIVSDITQFDEAVTKQIFKDAEDGTKCFVIYTSISDVSARLCELNRELSEKDIHVCSSFRLFPDISRMYHKLMNI